MKLGTGKRLTLSLLAVCVVGFSVKADARAMINTCPEAQAAALPRTLFVQTPALKYTVTNFDPSWFDTDHPQNAPTLFLLNIAPELKGLAGQLRLRVQIVADTSLGRNPGSALIGFDRISGPLDESKIGVTLRSNEVFELAWSPGGTNFQNSRLYDLILEKRVAPEMNLIFKFNLTCESNTDAAFADAQTAPIMIAGSDEGHLRYVKMIQALYPGTRITNPVPVPLYTVMPIFKVASELFNTKVYEYPPDQPRIEVFLYELPTGTNPKDAMDGLEFAKFGIFGESPTPYPANQPQLQPGMTYVWRARAILRGPTSDYLYSDPLYFKVDERLEGGSSIPRSELSELTTVEQQIKYGDDYSKRVMAALKIILGDNFEVFDLSRAGKIPAKGQIRLNGHPYSLEELERLAREFHQSRHSVTRLRFQ
ncbi:MAG: hypothetical protein ABIW76_11940 [Fibrobacteria bacterium]